MDLKRFFAIGEITDNTVTLKGHEFLHATKVCRAKVGYKFIACCNDDMDYYCITTAIAKDSLTAKVEKVLVNETHSDVNITLYVGVCKELDVVVQKAVEMGVSTVVPFTSQHSNVSSINLDRLNKIVLESSKQCGRSHLMQVLPLTTFSDALKQSVKSKTRVLFYEFERKQKLSQLLTKEVKDISVFIGSEGGFSVEEKTIAVESNIFVATLGKRILRVETAVVAALALCLQGTAQV